MLLTALCKRYWLFLFLLLGVQQSSAQTTRVLADTSIEWPDSYLWHAVDTSTRHPLLPPWPTASPAETTILGKSGVYVTALELSAEQTRTWYLVLAANFLDEGDAYWQPEGGKLKHVADFSQLSAASIPRIMHAQGFPVVLQAKEKGRLWLRINAKHYPTPAPITLYSQEDFYRYQFLVNTMTSGAVMVMLSLALMAFAFGMRTKQWLPLWCAGYVGLHAIGWAMASGLLSGFITSVPINLAYGGMYLFPFAIAFAALFTRDLFDAQEVAPKLAKYLNILCKVVLGLGVLMLFLPFQVTFYLSHLIALVWVPLSLYVATQRLSNRDFRAKYYLVGNLLYGASLGYFVLSHAHIASTLRYPELVVLGALAIDCCCIVLSLSEWLKIKQNEFQRVLFEARVDSLTKVANRFSLDEKLAALDGQHYLIVFIDLDGMKQINDSMGHEAGDTFLIEVANLMKSALGPQGDVFRAGGDEFVWLVTSESAITAEQIHDIESLVKHIDNKLQRRWPTAGVSFGVASNTETQDQFDCIACADKRMYQHKLAKR